MQNERDKDLRNPFDMFRGFGRNLFDNPFFSRSFGSMFGPSNQVGAPQPHCLVPPDAPIIRELKSDDDDDDEDVEGDEGENKEGGVNSARPASEPFVDHPDDESDDSTRRTETQTDFNRFGGTQTQIFKVHSCKVTYGGIDGVYYSSSSTRKMGSDGVIVEECKEADKSKGEATHRISRGLHDKGHSITRKLNPDGKVDTLQTLHNLKEDEVESFNESWRSNSWSNEPSWAGPFGNGMSHMPDVLLLPSMDRMGEARWTESNYATGADSSSSKIRKTVRIPIE